MSPLGDASRQPTAFPAVTSVIIVANAVVFLLELAFGDAFVTRWSTVPQTLRPRSAGWPCASTMFLFAVAGDCVAELDLQRTQPRLVSLPLV